MPKRYVIIDAEINVHVHTYFVLYVHTYSVHKYSTSAEYMGRGSGNVTLSCSDDIHSLLNQCYVTQCLQSICLGSRQISVSDISYLK